MPWHAITLSAKGDIKPCCQFSSNSAGLNTEYPNIIDNWNSQRMQNLRQEFLDGKMPTGCQSCWTREETVGASRRTWFDNKFSKYIEPDFEYTTLVKDPQFIQADINFSNLCNLKCRMCGTWGSNQWIEEEKILASTDERYKKNNIQPFQQKSLEDVQDLLPHLDKVKRIDFKGGEPMLAKAHTDFLEYLIKQNRTDIHLFYTTNGTVRNPNIIKMLDKFDRVSISFSIEGTGELYKYIRGGKYNLEDFGKSVKAYSDLSNTEIMYNVTVQNYNVLNLHKLYDYLVQLSEPYDNVSSKQCFTTICNNPYYLSPTNIPDVVRDQVVKNLEGNLEFEKLCQSLLKREFNPEHWEVFVKYTRQLDQMRNENFLNLEPAFTEYFKAIK